MARELEQHIDRIIDQIEDIDLDDDPEADLKEIADSLRSVQSEATEIIKELDDAEDAIYSFEQAANEAGGIEEKLALFADPANWVQRESDDKYVWSPYMAMTEQDPLTLANQILDTLRD